MKKFYVLLVVSLWSALAIGQNIVETKYYENHPELAGDITINQLTREVRGDKAYTSFNITAKESGSYYVNFWVCPSKLTDGSYSAFEVLADGKTIGRISPSAGDWQAISLDGERNINLREGVHTISIVGKPEDFPSVDLLRMSQDPERAKLSDSAYKEYKRQVTEESRSRAEENKRLYANRDTLDYSGAARRSSIFPLPTQDTPPYDADFVIGIGFSYTFFKVVHFTEGQNITLSTTGIDNYEHVLELFSRTTPESYSWVNKSDASCACSLSVVIPETGYYTVSVRSYENASSGLCNLNINNTYQYDSVPIFSSGIRGEKDTQNIYNSFTCYNHGDPILWVEEGMAPGKITAYNDDYASSSSDYSWGTNSRVKRQYASEYNAILITAYSSYTPTNKCDVYTNCLSAYTGDSDNMLQSAPATYYSANNYNCISWSGGIYTHFIWPPYVFVNEGMSDLEAFDHFYSMERYPGCSTFSRDGATSDNCAVELWATVNSDGTRDYTHASVRKSADINRHGFDWESKLGSLIRIYHPRNHVPYTDYGQIVEHYLRTDSGPGSGSLEEAIANGSAVIENVQFSTDENTVIENHIADIELPDLAYFNELYRNWEEIWNTTALSNPDAIANCDEYKRLLKLCQRNDNFKYAVFGKLGKGSVCAVCLVKDLTVKDNMELLRNVWSNNKKQEYTETGAKIIRSIYSNAMLYAKAYIKKQDEQLRKIKENIITGITYSNTDEFSVYSTDGRIILKFNNDRNAHVYADVIDVQGNVLGVFVNEKDLNPNSYSYQCELRKGVYFVRYIVDGNVNVKKIIVK